VTRDNNYTSIIKDFPNCDHDLSAALEKLGAEVQALQRAIAALRRELPSMVSESMLRTLDGRNRRVFPF
jgi:hypothetical protein